MKMLKVKIRDFYTGNIETSKFKNMKGVLDDFSIKNLYNQGKKVIEVQLENK